MTTCAARLATFILFALAVRAGFAQQPGYWNAAGADPYAPPYQPPNYQQPPYQQPPYQQPPGNPQPQPPAQTPYQPPANQPRYPLPGYPAWNQPGMNSAGSPQSSSVPNQALRYPLPTTAPPPAAPPMGAVQLPAGDMPQPPLPPVTVASAATAAPRPQAILFEPGQIVGRVGDKTILYCDVAPVVNMRLEPILKKARSDREREAIEAAYRDPLTKNVIDQLVFNKMLLMEFERGMPSDLNKDKKKKAEAEGKLRKTVRNVFDSSLNMYREKMANATPEETEKLLKQDPTMARLALIMKERHLESPGELDTALRGFGTSLEQQSRDYGEYIMGMEAARTKLGLGHSKTRPKEVTHEEMLDYYQAHVADYYVPAKARFEILTARPSRFGGDKQAARQLIEQMGNEVLLGGTPFPAVARKHSQEPHASEGGYYDWVTPGSLASKPIDQAIFTLEVDKLSQIIEDENGYHIVHVLERKEAGQISFIEAQPEIRKAIESERRSTAQAKYLGDLRARTKVWTVYDPPPAEAGPATINR